MNRVAFKKNQSITMQTAYRFEVVRFEHIYNAEHILYIIFYI